MCARTSHVPVCYQTVADLCKRVMLALIVAAVGLANIACSAGKAVIAPFTLRIKLDAALSPSAFRSYRS